jgi:hypothetical protein
VCSSDLISEQQPLQPSTFNTSNVNEDAIFAADQEVADASATMATQPFSTCLQLENIEQAVFCVAPGEGSTPQYILMDEKFEEGAYPDVHPYGVGGFHPNTYKTKLHRREYYKQRLFNVDGRFARNIEYVFSSQYATELQQIQGNISLALHLKGGRQYHGQNITAGMLRNPQWVSSLVQREDAYKMLKTIRGSPAYWQSELYDVLAMLRAFGTPTWFLTLSVADYQWPEIIRAVGIQYGRIFTDDDVKKMSWEEKSMYLRSNPVTACRVFQHRVDSFLSKYLCSAGNPIGRIKQYVIKTEFQARGTPHIHCLFWIEDAPLVDVAPDAVVCQFIDETISGCIPEQLPAHYKGDVTENDIKQWQSHACSTMYCFKNQRSCRFGFPKPPSLHTIIARKPSSDDEDANTEKLKTAQNILQKVKDVIHLHEEDAKVNDSSRVMENITLQNILDECAISADDYMQSLSVCRTGTTVVLQRDVRDIHVNGHNPGIVAIWRANTDMQFVATAYGAVMYICSYMMKSERGMSELLQRVGQECRGRNLKEQLKVIGKTFLGNREVSAQEAVMRETSLPLMQKSVKVEFVSANPKEERISRPRFDLKTLHDDEEDVFATSIHDRYAARPDALVDMCLAKFAVNYTVVTGGGSTSDVTGGGTTSDTVNAASDTDDVRDIDDIGGVVESNTNDNLDATHTYRGRKKAETITLKNNLGKMRKRQKEAVLRTSTFNIQKNREKHFHAQLILFYPWRKEDELCGYVQCGDDTIKSYEVKYQDVKTVVDANATHFNRNVDDIDAAWSILLSNGPPESAWDGLAPSMEMENAATQSEAVQVLRSSEYFTDNTIGDGRALLGQMYVVEAKKVPMTTPEYNCNYLLLNAEQKAIVDFNREWCKKAVRAMRTGSAPPEAYRVHLGGPGGTGKSFVINLCHRDVLHLFQNCKLTPDNPLVLRTAPTGTAAFNISGITYHSALGFSSVTQGLSHEKRTVLRTRFSQLKLLIIDECSMIGLKRWEDIHLRLCDICGLDPTEEPFANICVLAVGDLYQLPPVHDKSVTTQKRTIQEISDFAPSLWDAFQYHELTMIMRQRDDDNFAHLLNSIRKGQIVEGSQEDILLKARTVHCDSGSADYPNDCLHVYAYNKPANIRNTDMLNTLDMEMYTICAVDASKDMQTNIASVCLPDNPMHTGKLHKVLKLRVGARVILTNNIDVTDGLTNGAMGCVQHIICNSTQDYRKKHVETILVKFDNVNVGVCALQKSKYKHISTDGVPIERYHATFFVKGRKSFEATRLQFPFFLAWGVTIYKVQGLTLDSGIVVDMDSVTTTYRYGEAYVAFSRVRKYEHLHIVNYNIKQIKTSPTVIAEEARLLNECKLQTIDSYECSSDQCKTMISISHQNVEGLLTHNASVQNHSTLLSADVICLSETHLQTCHTVAFQDFCGADVPIVARVDTCGRRGGVVICAKSWTQATEITLTNRNEETQIDMCAVEIHAPTHVIVLCIYRPPHVKKETLLACLAKTLEKLRGVPICIVGDFNEDLLGGDGHHICSFLAERGFTQIVQQSTTDAGTLIDHVYVDNIPVNSCTVHDCHYSYHDCVICEVVCPH